MHTRTCPTFLSLAATLASFLCSATARASDPPPADDWLAPPSRNMLANPDFELGWNGWTFDAFTPETPEIGVQKITAEPTRIEEGAGLDGGDAMRIGPGVHLVSECVPIEHGQPYAISAYFKAREPDTKIKLFFIDTGFAFYSKEITVGTEWQRESLAVTWNKPSKSLRAYVRIDADGVLVDRVQLERGAVTPFAAPPAAVGLVSDGSNIFMRSGGVEGLKLKAVVDVATPLPVRVDLAATDAWGRPAWTRRFEITEAGATLRPLEDLPADRLGVFHVRLTATDAEGQPAGIAEGRYAMVDPPAAPMSAEGFPLFGVCYEFSRFPAWVDEPSLTAMQTMGMGMNRFFMPKGVGWATDEYLAAFTEARKTVLRADGPPQIAVLSDIGPWTEMVEGDDLSSENIRQFQDACRKVVRALHGQVGYWEVFNEPNLWRYKSGPKKGLPSMPPQKYVPLLKAAYEAIKSVDPELKVVGVCLNGASYDYLQQVMDLGARQWMDVFSFHPYRSAPDEPDTYSDLLRMREIVRSAGFEGPIINDEQYFAANLFAINGWDEETRRGYYVNEEIWAAGRTIANYIHHAAAGVSYCAFAPDYTTVRYGGSDRFFLWDLYGAYNAATRMLDGCGPGQPVAIGENARAWAFPEAAEGPLLVLYTMAPRFTGRAQLAADVRAHDMMGNRIPTDEVRRRGVPLDVTPVYVRFAPGTSLTQIQQLLREAHFTGLGEPFGLRLLMRGDGRPTVRITNQSNRTASGTLTLDRLPQRWVLQQTSRAFDGLAPNASIDLDFPGDTPMASLETYALAASVVSGTDEVRRDLHIAPLVADPLPSPIPSDAELLAWSGWNWIALGEGQLSREFTPNVPHTGAADLSAQLAVGWTPDAFVVALRATDDVEDHAAEAMAAYKHDSLQLYFDQLANAPRPESAFDGDDIAYSIALIDGRSSVWLDKGSEGRYIGQANQSTGLDGDVHATITRSGNLTTYLVRIPTRCLPRVTLERGAAIGFSLLLNDNDDRGRKQGLTLAPRGQEPFNRPYHFRTLIFR